VVTGLEPEEGGVRKLEGGASPHSTSALTGVSKLPQKRSIGKAPERKVAHILGELDG